MGVMLSTLKSTDSKLSPDARLNLLTMALTIELIPRVMWKLAFPLGLQLSAEIGLVDVSGTVLAVVWVLALIWAGISVGGAANAGKPIGERLGAINRIIIPVVGVVTLLLGAYSYVAGAPFMASWLSLKVAMYGLINLTIFGIEAAFAPAVPAYLQMVQTGATPEINEKIKTTVNRTMIFVASTYILIAVVGFSRTSKVLSPASPGAGDRCQAGPSGRVR